MRIAVFAPDTLRAHFCTAIEREGQTVLDSTGVETCDEWQTKRWFAENKPDLVLLGVESGTERMSRELLVNLQGSVNVISAATDFVRHLRLYSPFASNIFFSLRRLCDLYASEKVLDYSGSWFRNGHDLVEQAVLAIQHVSSEETDTASPEGAHEEGEVRDQVVPEPTGREGDALPGSDGPVDRVRGVPGCVLEVPRQAVQAPEPGDVCPECDAGPSPAAQDTVHHHAGTV
jgi:hypothetical protein